MKNDFDNIVTGTLSFRGVAFTFVYDREELRLIPLSDDKSTVEQWFRRELARGVYAPGDPIYVEEEFLVGKCNEGYEIILFPIQGQSVSRINDVLVIEIQAYIWKQFEGKMVDRIGFESPEIDCIFPVRNAISLTSWTQDGEFKVETKSYEDTTTEAQNFFVDEKEVSVHFGISRIISGDFTKPPLALRSEMYFEFEVIDNYAFILRLCRIAKVFVQYLCYRKNVPFTAINISAPHEGGKHIKYANLYILDDKDKTEIKCLKDGRVIQQKYISGCEGKMLSDIADGLLYTRNIPTTYKQGQTIDAARFVMITAAFEWEFRRLYPDGITKRQRTIDAEDLVELVIKELWSKSTGKVKEICKGLLNGIRFTQLSSRIIHTGKNLGDVIDVFGEYLYRLNNQKLDYSEMGLRLGKQRNNYAHGNLNQEFVGLALLDLIYLELIIYAMQLKFYGISDLNVKRAINDLFHKNFLIRDEEDSST